MALLKGGRGKKAPWEDAHVRVPVPIKEEIQQQIDDWKTAQLNGEKTEHIKPLTGDDVDEIKEEVARQKKSGPKSLEIMAQKIKDRIN